MSTRAFFFASVLSVFAVGCGDKEAEKGAPNDGGAGDSGGGDGGGIDVGPAPPGFELVADLNTRHHSALDYSPIFFEGAGKLFFVADDGVHGREPMVSDGTAAGTKLLKDLAPGLDNGSAGAFVAKGDKVYFFGAKDSGTWLYRTDGTPEGTTPVISGSGGSSTAAFTIGEKVCFLDSTLRCTDAAVTAFTKIMDASGFQNVAMSLGAQAVFSSGNALWSTDGATATKLVDVEIQPGGVVVNGKAVFWAENSGQTRPYVSDGTLAGSRPLADITGSSGSLSPMIALGSNALTVTGGAAYAFDLSATTATYTKIADLNARSGIGIGGGKALLFADRPSASTSIGAELWVTDGTDGGTTLVSDLNPGSTGSSIRWLGTIGSSAFFLEGKNLWKSDGTPGGTAKLGEWTVDSQADRPGWTTALGRLAFKCADATSWATLCTIDASGKVTVIPINAATAPSSPDWFATYGDKLLFNTNHGPEPVSSTHGSMFVSDGTTAGTKRIGPRFGGNLAKLGTKTFFTRYGAEGTDKWELASFDADPAAAATAVTFNYRSNLEYTRPFPIVPFGGKVWFAANAGTSGSITLHSSDGSVLGTKSFAYTPSAGYAQYGGPTWPIVGPAMYVPTTSGLIVIDEAGTATPLASATGKIGALDAADGRIWFAIGGTLWITDGTTTGTTQVKTITTSTSSPIWRIIAINKNFAYVFTGSGSSPALHSSDGTSTGTKLIANAPEWTRFRDGLAYATSSGITFVSPTTPTVSAIVPDARRLLGAGERLFFASSETMTGEELWISDGTLFGAKRAGDLRAGKLGSTPTPRVAVGNHVYFTADDGGRGTELWRYRFP